MKHILAFVLLVSLCIAASACSDPEADAAIESCKDFCVNQGNASDCPAIVVDEIDQCSDACGFVVKQLSDDCQIKANAFYSCSASMDTWMCQAGSDLPFATDDSCEQELEAYSACFAADG